MAGQEGELGDVHISTVLCLVSRAFFEAMRREGWQMEAGQRPRSAYRMMEGGGRPPQAASSVSIDVLALDRYLEAA